VPPWGRPSGAKGGSRRRKQWEWEREQARQQQQARVEELDSDDTDTQGVGLIYEKEKRFASDPIHVTGTDLASMRVRRSYTMEDSADSSSSGESEAEAEGIDALQIALREKEEALVQSALRRIRRAQEKGKSEVKLNQEELDALENRRKRMQAAATTRPRKGSGSSNGSGTEKKKKIRRSERTITIPLAPPEPQSRSSSRPSSRPSSSRRSSKSIVKRNDEMPINAAQAAFMVAGADGLTYAPMGIPPQASPHRTRTSRPRASTSSQAIRSGPAPYFPYAPGSQRQAYEHMRPASSASHRARPMPDEEGWVPTNSRRSSGASSYVIDPFEYQVSSDTPPPIPAQYMTQQSQVHPPPGRRVVSGPQDVTYSSLRRSVGPGGATFGHVQSRGPIPDPFLYERRSENEEQSEDNSDDSGSGSGSGSGSSSEDSSDDLGNGVQVAMNEREREQERERAIVSLPRKPVGGGKKNRKRQRV